MRGWEGDRYTRSAVCRARVIAPSVLSADFGRLAEDVQAAERAGADWFHVDIMDGHFVPNLSMGPDVVKVIRRATSLPLDVHMMVSDPKRYAPRFIDAGADWMSIHYEACPEPRELIAEIRSRGARPSVGINPETPVAVLAPTAAELDMLLVMSVHPGFGGQKFIPEALAKLSEARAMRERLNARFLIEIDGGITVENASAAAAAGADVIVAGTAVFGAPDYAAAITAMRRSIPGTELGT